MTPLQKALRTTLVHLQDASSSVYQAQQAVREFWPAKDRCRYMVTPEQLASGLVDQLPVPLPQGTSEHHTLVGSLTHQGTHRPVLDLDAVGAALVPSTTEGNFHLYLDGIELSWREYKRFLKACARAGLITDGYLRHSLRRRQTTVRRPGLTKTWKERQRKASYEVEAPLF